MAHPFSETKQDPLRIDIFLIRLGAFNLPSPLIPSHNAGGKLRDDDSLLGCLTKLRGDIRTGMDQKGRKEKDKKSGNEPVYVRHGPSLVGRRLNYNSIFSATPYGSSIAHSACRSFA